MTPADELMRQSASAYWQDDEDEFSYYDDEDDGRCIHCGAETGHYNGCIEDPDAMCLCYLCMGDDAVTSEAACPFHGGGQP